MKEDIAGWRLRQMRRRKRYESTPEGRLESEVTEELEERKRESHPWLRRETKRRGKSFILRAVQVISQGGREMYFVPLIRWT